MASIRGAIIKWRFRSSDRDYGVAEYKTSDGHTVSVVGAISEADIGYTIEVYGDWETVSKHGLQFKAVSWIRPFPIDSVALLEYLRQGNVSGVGPAKAQDLYDYFRDNLYQVLDESPERIEETPGFGKALTEKFVESWKEQQLCFRISIELRKYELSSNLVKTVSKTLGTKAIQSIQENPYVLTKIRGIGFKRIDAVLLKIGADMLNSNRICSLVLYLLEKADDDGHYFLNRDAIAAESLKEYKVPRENIISAIDSLVLSEEVVDESFHTTSGDLHMIYTKKKHSIEIETAEMVVTRLQAQGSLCCPANLPELIDVAQKSLGFVLNSEQTQAISNVFQCSLSILTGAPGTGKTASVKVLLKVMHSLGIKPTVCAPTGRAAKHIQTITAYPAATIHKILGYRGENKWTFNEDNPLEGSVFIVDEMSMVDLKLFHQFLRALPSHSNVLLIGDKDQLPAVGAGRVLDDLLRCNRVSTIRLKQVFRQAAQSLIIQNAHRILKGESMIFPETSSNGHPVDCFQQKAPMIDNPETGKKTEDTEWIKQRIRRLVVDRIPAKLGVDPIRQIQVLTPMIQYDCGVEDLNILLQDVLNPNGKRIETGGKKFRIGDRVLMCENNTELGLSNGDIGFVKEYDEKEDRLLVDFYSDLVSIPSKHVSSLKLGYALSVHKAQGSESEVVIFVLLKRHFVMLRRNLLFTAVTRAKQMLIVFASSWVLNQAIRNVESNERNSFLPHRIQASLPKRVIA